MRVGSVSFLYADYKPAAWWYELFVMGRKLFMSGVLVFVYEGTATQIVVALLVALCSLAVLYEVDPYLNPSDATLAKFAQWSEVFVLLGALLVKMKYLMSASSDEALFSFVVIAALLVPVALAVGAAVRDVHVALKPIAEREASGGGRRPKRAAKVYEAGPSLAATGDETTSATPGEVVASAATPQLDGETASE